MITVEKWYSPCGSKGPRQSGPACAVEHKIEALVARVRELSPNVTANLYWNSMFDFSMYSAHQRMLDLEADGVHAFLRDETGAVISLCNDGNVYCNITQYDWTQAAVRQLWVDVVVNATRVRSPSRTACKHNVAKKTSIFGFETFFGPSTLGAGTKTHRKSRFCLRSHFEK